MKPIFFYGFLLQIPIVIYFSAILLEDQKFIQNLDIIKNISSFAALTTSILIGLLGLLVVSKPKVGVEKGRHKRLSLSCISLVLLSLICFAVTTLSIELVPIRPFSISTCISLLISTLLVLLGISSE